MAHTTPSTVRSTRSTSAEEVSSKSPATVKTTKTLPTHPTATRSPTRATNALAPPTTKTSTTRSTPSKWAGAVSLRLPTPNTTPAILPGGAVRSDFLPDTDSEVVRWCARRCAVGKRSWLRWAPGLIVQSLSEQEGQRGTPFLCPTKGRWRGMPRRTGLLFAWMSLAVLLVGSLPADARQLAKVEAEKAKVGTWGAVVNDASASAGKAVRWNKPATTGTVNFTIGEPAESATVYIKAGSKSSSRVCVRPKVDGVALGTQPLCVGAKQGSYVGRTFAANLAAGSHTLTLTGSEISGTDRLFADYTSFDTSTSGTPDPYTNPDTTSQTFGEGWTPAAGSVHLNPRITCSADPTPANADANANTANTEVGVNITNVNKNVVLINPRIEGCSVGIRVKAEGFKLLADKGKVGYASAASPAIHNNYKGVVFDRGAFGYEVEGLNGGELFMRDNYIPVNLQAGYDCLIADTHIDHPN